MYVLHCIGVYAHCVSLCMVALHSTGHGAEDGEHIAGTLPILSELCWVPQTETTPLCCLHGMHTNDQPTYFVLSALTSD